MKKLIQKAVKVLAFLLVLALCYGLMDQVLKIKTDDMVSMVKLRQLPPGLSEGIVNELLLAGEELLPAGAVGAALGSPLILLGVTGGLFLIRLAQLPGLVLVLLRDLLCLAASCRRQGFYLPLCIRLDALGDPFQSLHGLLRFTECW